MAMAAAAARVLRGGRRSGACSNLLPLMPGIGRRAPLERAAGPLLPRLGAAGDAVVIGRRLMSEEVPRAPLLDRLNEQYVYIRGSGRFVPYDSELVLVDLATRLDAIERHERYLRYAAGLVGIVLVGFWGRVAYLYYQIKAIEKSLDEVVACLEEVEALLRESEEQMP